MYLNIIFKVLACQGAGVAVHGYYPFIFPSRGYRGQLWWLANIAGCFGKEAYKALLDSSKEGEVELPLHIEIKLEDGQTIHLGPNLTSPNTYNLHRIPSVTATKKVGLLLVTHKNNNKQDKQEADWVTIPETEENIASEVEDLLEISKPEDKSNFKKEEKCKGDYNDSEDFPKEKNFDELNVELLEQRRVNALESKKLYVHFDDTTISKEQLNSHFNSYGEVQDIYFPTSTYLPAVVTYSSPAVVTSLIGREHSLGGSVPLRLRGGSGRHRIPPTTLQDSVCPFRYDIE